MLNNQIKLTSIFLIITLFVLSFSMIIKAEDNSSNFMIGTQYTGNYRSGASAIMKLNDNISVQGIFYTGWWRRSSITARCRYKIFTEENYDVYSFGGASITTGFNISTDFPVQIGVGIELDIHEYFSFLHNLTYYRYIKEYPLVYNLEIGSILLSELPEWNGLFIGTGIHYKF